MQNAGPIRAATRGRRTDNEKERTPMIDKSEFRARKGYVPWATSAADALDEKLEAAQQVREVLTELGDASGAANTLYAAGGIDRTGADDHQLMVKSDLAEVAAALEEVHILGRRLNAARGDWGRAAQDFYAWLDLEAEASTVEVPA
jgi:hypothetical protein